MNILKICVYYNVCYVETLLYWWQNEYLWIFIHKKSHFKEISILRNKIVLTKYIR